MKRYKLIEVDTIKFVDVKTDEQMLIFEVISDDDERSVFGITNIDFVDIDEEGDKGTNMNMDVHYFTKITPSKDDITEIIQDILKLITDEAKNILNEEEK